MPHSYRNQLPFLFLQARIAREDHYFITLYVKQCCQMEYCIHTHCRWRGSKPASWEPRFPWIQTINQNCEYNSKYPYLPLLTSQRGDSGTNQMKKSWITEGKAWSAEGIRHAKLLGIRKVPKVYNYIGYWIMWHGRITPLTVQAALGKGA